MSTAILWGSIGILILFIGLGILIGMIRGLKRSSIHLAFFIASFILAYFITRPVSNAILGYNIQINGEMYTISGYIIHLIASQFDLTNFSSVTTFITELPSALISPIVYIVLFLLSYLIFDIIYLIVARVAFGKKKVEFKTKKPYRPYGALIGMFEGLAFMILLFSPLTSLTDTYSQIAFLPPSQVQTQIESEDENQDKHLQTVPQLIKEYIPQQADEAIKSLNNSVMCKVAAMGGLNNLLFDGLSGIKVEGQNINFRQEIMNLTDTYDSFVIVYNHIIDKDYTQVEFSAFKLKLEKVLNNNLFKTVIANTIQNFVINYEDLANQLNLKLPQIVNGICSELKEKFSDETFDINEYLKSDILNVVDAANTIFKSGIIDDFQSVENKDLIEILKFISADERVGTLKSIIDDVFNLNIVEDAFSSLVHFASDQLVNLFPEKEGKEKPDISFNSNISDVKELVEKTMNIVDNFLVLSNDLNLPALISAKGEDIISILLSDDVNLEKGLNNAGQVLTDLRNLDILVIPPEEEGGESTYVLDKIMEYFDFNVLGDTVYIYQKTENGSVKIETLDNYVKFFDYIKTPILNAKNLGLMKSQDMKNIIDGLLTELQTNPDIIASTLLTFKNLTAFNLNTLVFDEIVKTINESGVLDLTYLQTLDTNATTEILKKESFKTWYEEFENLGKIINNLNSGNIEDKKYIDYILDENPDYDKLIDSIANDENFENIFAPIFKSDMFRPLNEKILTTIDNTIGDLTKLYTKSDIEKLKLDSSTKAIHELLLKINDIKDLNNLKFETIGEILEILKKNAKENGVFDKTFANLIWYMTGDKMTIIENENVEELTAHEEHEKIKTYLGTENDGYLEINFVDKFSNIDVALKMGQELADDIFSQFSGELSAEDTEGFVESLTGVVQGYIDQGVNVEEILDSVDMFIDENFVDANGKGIESIIPQDQEIKDELSNQLTTKFSNDPGVADALKRLLGLE